MKLIACKVVCLLLFLWVFIVQYPSSWPSILPKISALDCAPSCEKWENEQKSRCAFFLKVRRRTSAWSGADPSEKIVMKNIAVGRAKRTVGGFLYYFGAKLAEVRRRTFTKKVRAVLHRIGAKLAEVRRRTFTNFPEIIYFENYKLVPFSYRFGANVAELAHRTC